MQARSIPPAAVDREIDAAQYTVVWNDAVDLTQLSASLVVCSAVSLPVFLVARTIFGGLVGTPSLASGYALLAGLGGCIVSAAICARLFPPKRRFDRGSATDREAALAELERMGGTLEQFELLPSAVRSEMCALGLAPATSAAADLAAPRDHGTES